ncbi:hypothetical protein Aduo_001641 [Ancylostoma duodenale]
MGWFVETVQCRVVRVKPTRKRSIGVIRVSLRNSELKVSADWQNKFHPSLTTNGALDYNDRIQRRRLANDTSRAAPTTTTHAIMHSRIVDKMSLFLFGI